MNSARDFTEKAGGYAFDMSGVLNVRTSDGLDIEMEATYRVGVDDVLLRQIEVSGYLDPSVIGALIYGISADSAYAELTVNFSDYGKEVSHESPYLVMPRFSHDAILLDDGRVLVSGGFMGAFLPPEASSENRIWAVGGIETLGDDDYVVLTTTEIFDPATDVWSPGPEMSQPRANH